MDGNFIALLIFMVVALLGGLYISLKERGN